MYIHRRLVAASILFVFSARLSAQDKPAVDEKKLTFHFKDASLDEVLGYVNKVTGWIFVQEKPLSGVISAISETAVPVSKCLEFLNNTLRSHRRVILNPYSPTQPKDGQTLKILDVSDALKRESPFLIPLTDHVRTQIVPLKVLSVIDVQKELGDVLKSALTGPLDGTTGSMTISSYSNSVILTGQSKGITRAVEILHVIDGSPPWGWRPR